MMIHTQSGHTQSEEGKSDKGMTSDMSDIMPTDTIGSPEKTKPKRINEEGMVEKKIDTEKT